MATTPVARKQTEALNPAIVQPQPLTPARSQTPAPATVEANGTPKAAVKIGRPAGVTRPARTPSATAQPEIAVLPAVPAPADLPETIAPADIDSDTAPDIQTSATAMAAQGMAPAAQAPVAFSAEITPIAQPAADTAPQPEPQDKLDAAPRVSAPPPAPSVKTLSSGERQDAPAAPPEAVGNFARATTAFTSDPVVPGKDQSATKSEAPSIETRSNDTARAQEPPPVAEAPKLHAGAVQEIAVRIAGPEAQSVDLRVTERAGQIHVAVRTPDADLQTSLRQDLGSLSGSLERAGYHAETFVPRAAGSSAMNLREEREAGQQGFSNRGSQSESGNGKQKRQQSSQSWLEELEQSQ